MIQVHADLRGLVLQHPNPAAVLQAVPSAFDLGGGLVGMPHDLDTVIRLGYQLKIEAPSPVEHYYDYPRDPTLFEKVFDHQVTTAGFITRNPRCYVLNGIGTMKTVTALWAADYLMREGYVRRALVVAPIEALERAWADTVFFHLRHRKHVVLHGSADKRRKLLAKDADFYVINPHGLPVIEKDLDVRSDLDLFIIDELADFRNKHNMWKALERLIYPKDRPPKPWVWGLTGTPMPQSPEDVYWQCRLITPTTVPQYFGQWKSMVMEKHSTYVWTPRQEAVQIAYQAMRPSIRYTRDDCLDLPGEIHSTLDVEMSNEQKRHYKEIQREFVTEIQGNRVSAVNEGVKLSKLMQIACGVVYATDGKPVVIDAGSRIEILLRTIERIHEKVIVFVPFTEVTNMLYQHIAPHWSAAVVYGDVATKERNQIFSDFQTKDDPSIIIAHPKCMARSLTLTEASTVIWYAPIDSNYDYEQANGRITRQGQKYVANIIHLSGSAVERKAYKRLAARQALQGMLLDLVEKGEQFL